MTKHLARVISALERHGCRPQHGREEQWRARCPGPCHRRGDLRPSLGIKGLPDKVIFYCHVCRGAGKAEILNALGLTYADLFAGPSAQVRPRVRHRHRWREDYGYTDINGRLLAVKVRYEPKSFRWRSPRPGGRSEWKKAEGVTLYRLAQLVDERFVLVVEGERSVCRLVALGFVATCPPSGSSAWLKVYAEVLWRAGALEVVVIPDNDSRGRDHARRVVEVCHGFRPGWVGFSIEPEEPWSAWPFAEADDPEVQPLRAKLLELKDLPYRGDVCDWLNAGHTVDELQALIDAAPDLDAVRQAKRDRARMLARLRQRRHRARVRAAAG